MVLVECISPFVRLRTMMGLKCFCQKARSPTLYYYRFHNQSNIVATYHHKTFGEMTIKNLSPITVFVRNYAKGKDKKKDKGKHKVVLDERMLADIVPLEDIKLEMQKAVEHLKQDYVQSLSIRSSTGAIENLHVSFEGKEYSVQELGQVARKDTKTVIINMVAFPQAIPAVLKALQKSGMNLNPQQDGTTLFIPVPKVTAEHRAQLAKNAKALFVQCRDAVRSIQVKHEKKLKNSSLAQDIVFNAQQQLVTLADSYIGTADSMLQVKVKELTGKGL